MDTTNSAVDQPVQPKPSEIIRERANNILKTVEDILELEEKGVTQIAISWPHQTCSFIPTIKEYRGLYKDAILAIAAAGKKEADLLFAEADKLQSEENNA